MEETDRQSLDRLGPVSSSGDRSELQNMTDQTLLPQEERTISANPSSDTVMSGASRNTKDMTATFEISGGQTTIYPFNSFKPQDQGYYFGGFENDPSNWDDRSNYVNHNNLHIMPPAMYSENSSFFFPPGYGFDSPMAYGQFSPLPSPLSTIMFDGQLFSPQQMPATPPYFPPAVSPGLPHATSTHSASQAELMMPGNSHENFTESSFFGPGSGYYLPVGSFGGGDLSGNSGLGVYNFPGEFGSSEPLPSRSNAVDTSRYMPPLSSGTVYPLPIGILGSYEQNVPQAPFQGFGRTSNSTSRYYTPGSSYQSRVGPSFNRNRLPFEKGGRHDKDRDAINMSADTLGVLSDRNRGPRASKVKGKSSPEDGSSSGVKDIESTSGFRIDQINNPDFNIDYVHAKIFVIKSFSEDNIHKSIKYSVWSSTPLGNRKLDAAYSSTKEIEGNCPLFLFFSVNASGQFCGVAEMIGNVDFENDADYWRQDRWSGQFPVKWHIIKDVPNSLFRHILLDNNDNKPVTHSRDSQEVKLEQGLEILKIFKNCDANTSLLDDFKYYDEREKYLLEKRSKQIAISTGSSPSSLAIESINQLSNSLVDSLRLDGDQNISRTTDLE